MLGEFVSAIFKSGDQYLNFLLKADREYRTDGLKRVCQESGPPERVRVFVFGSFIRQKFYRDVDLMIVHEELANIAKLKLFESELERQMRKRFGVPDITVTSAREFATLKLKYDNLAQVYPDG